MFSILGQKYMYKLCKGFTLAEVLVTLAVIGIVASLTIPSLIKSYQEKQYKSAFKKNYQMLEQARLMVKANNGGSLKGLSSSYNGLHNEYIKYLKIVKIVPAGWNRTGVTYYNGDSISSFTWGGYYALYLNNGAMLQVFNYVSDCDIDRYTLDTPSKNVSDACAYIYLDTNAEKGPNVLGKDYFMFSVTDNTIQPYYGNYRYDVNGDDCNTSGLGHYCGAKYLKNE